MTLPRTAVRGIAFIALSLFARSMFADAPIPGTFHVVCGAAPEDGVLSAVAGAPIVLEADAVGVQNTYSWQFSDGSTDDGFQVTHAFPTGGVQTVSLSVVTPGPHEVGSTEAIRVLGLGAEPNALVIAGAGFTGNWDTEIVLGNPYDSELTVLLFVSRISSQYAGCMLSTCPPPQPAFVTLGPGAEQTVRYSEVFPPGITGLYVSGAPGDVPARTPMIRARAYATDQPARAMELPIVTYESLVSRPVSPLVFVGASRSNASHSNLFLADTANFVESGVSVHVDAIDASGQIQGSLEQSIPAGRAVVISDVLGSMGIAAFTGQLRVTQIGGTGVVDGALATLTDDGGFAVSQGFVP